MATASHKGTASLSTCPAACPFCGQPLLNKKAVEHLAREMAAYESELRRTVEAEVQSRADSRVRQLEKSLRTDAAKQAKKAASERAAEVAELTRRLEAADKNQAAMVKAQVQEQLATIAEKERARLQHEYAKREKQLQATVQTLEDQKSELSRRVERLSAGDRGEFNEDDLFSQLMRAFPDDDIQRTRRGQRGADIFQRVRFRSNGELTEAGLIIHECKDTLKWSNSFISQVKAQAKLHGTPYAILVSRCFPRGKKMLVVLDDVVVVDPVRLVALTEIMRRMVIESYRSGVVAGSQAEKTAELFAFISSTEFQQAFESLTEAVDTLDNLLSQERRNHQKAWTERGRIYQTISDTVSQLDARFTCILESTAQRANVHPLHRSSA